MTPIMAALQGPGKRQQGALFMATASKGDLTQLSKFELTSELNERLSELKGGIRGDDFASRAARVEIDRMISEMNALLSRVGVACW